MNAENYYANEYLTTKFLVGVKIHAKDPDEDSDRYFLLTEDFTNGGTADFRPGALGESTGRLEGKLIYYDFEEDFRGTKGFRFFDDKAIIHIHLHKE